MSDLETVTPELLQTMRWTALGALIGEIADLSFDRVNKVQIRERTAQEQATLEMIGEEMQRRNDPITPDQLREISRRVLATSGIKAIMDRVGRYGWLTDEERAEITAFCDEQQVREFETIQIDNFRLFIPILRRVLSEEWAGLDDPRVDALVTRYRVGNGDLAHDERGFYKPQPMYLREFFDFYNLLKAHPDVYKDFARYDHSYNDPDYDEWAARNTTFKGKYIWENVIYSVNDHALAQGIWLMRAVIKGEVPSLKSLEAIEWLQHENPNFLYFDFSEGMDYDE